MIRLTPELTCLSGFLAAAAAIETRQLDFNLARREAVIINRIIGQLNVLPIAVTGDGQIVQELDRAPDNVGIWGSPTVIVDEVEYDSSRIFRQQFMCYSNITVATQGLSHYGNPNLQIDFTHQPMNERPISITPYRHNVCYVGGSMGAVQSLLQIQYIIVELTLAELGLVNATRR